MAVALRGLFGRRKVSGHEDVVGRVTGLMQGWSIETTPKQMAKLDHVPLAKGTRVNIAYLPDDEASAVLQAAARLVFEGMIPVPHVPARTIASAEALETYVRGMAAIGVREALVIGGGGTGQAGPFADSMAVLKTGLFQELGFTRIGVAGHPEGSPDIDAHGLAAALAAKNEWAESCGMTVELMTQFCFNAEQVVQWEKAIRASGNRLPIRIGLPGPASIKSLLRYAQMCGVGNSLSFLSKRAGNVLQLVTAAEPDGFIVDLSKAVADDPDNLVAGLHFYPFGGFDKTAGYASAVANGSIAVESDGEGFSVRA